MLAATVTGAVAYPLATGLFPATPPTSAIVGITYTAAVTYPSLTFTGTQTHAIDLATMPAAGLRALFVSFDAVDASNVPVITPVTVNFTPGGSQELTPGGVLVFASPTPAAGITAISIASTANAVLHVAAFG